MERYKSDTIEKVPRDFEFPSPPPDANRTLGIFEYIVDLWAEYERIDQVSDMVRNTERRCSIIRKRCLLLKPGVDILEKA